MPDRRVVILALAAGMLAHAAPAAGQSDGGPPLRVVAERAELKWSATGRLLGRLDRGATVEQLGGREGWTRALVRGWMRSSELSSIEGGFEVEPDEAALHGDPNGSAFGALVQGVDVRRIGGQGDWLRIEMIGWMADSTVAAAEAEAESQPEPTPTPPPAGAATPPAEDGAGSLMGRLGRRSELRGAPEGSALAELPAGTVVRAHETRGGWTRVTVEGWVPDGVIEAGGETDVGPEIVAGASAGAFVGREVSWTLEHVALQTADEWRTDLVPGETFGLARVPGNRDLYVYLAIPDRLVDGFTSLEPFERIRIQGRVRTGRSGLTGVPIVDVTRLHR